MLASGSPRRRELLAALIRDFDILVSDIPEPTTGDAVADALALAAGKASAVAEQLTPGTVVIGSDTIVFDEVRSYGKPADPAGAVAMLTELAGRTHRVVTGVSVCRTGSHETGTAASISKVTLTALDSTAIADYVASGRPLDKAGAYAIQDEDVPTVAELEGCFCGVMGLPLWQLKALLAAMGIETGDPSACYQRCATCPERALLGFR